MTTARKSKRRQRGMSDTQAAKLMRMAREAPALLTKEQTMEYEAAFVSDGYARRGALAVLTITGAELHSTIEKDETAAAFADLAARIQLYTEQLNGLLDLIRQADMRVMMALANRVDMTKLIEDAQAALKEPTPPSARPKLYIVPTG